MIPFNLTTLTRETLLVQRKAETLNIFPGKTFQSFTINSFGFSSFNLISRSSSEKFSTNTALQNFKEKAMAEMNSQFNFDEAQEKETQPIYLSSDESEIILPCSSPTPWLPKNVPDTYSTITQLITAQHEEMSSPGTLPYSFRPPHQLR